MNEHRNVLEDEKLPAYGASGFVLAVSALARRVD
jgi:hypothetical protein